MRISLPITLLVCIYVGSVFSLGDSNSNFDFEDQDSENFDIPSETEPIVDQRTTEEVPERSEELDEPTPPSIIAAPLDPLPGMTALARPPGFRPPSSFKPTKTAAENDEKVNVGFVVRRGRAKVMGFSRRKTESITSE